jgi:hypothetical protein
VNLLSLLIDFSRHGIFRYGLTDQPTQGATGLFRP